MTKQKTVPRWVVAAPEWAGLSDPNVEVVPAKAYDDLRKILADGVFREMNGMKPVLRTDSMKIEPSPAVPCAHCKGSLEEVIGGIRRPCRCLATQDEPRAECEWCKSGWLPLTGGVHRLPNGQNVPCVAENR